MSYELLTKGEVCKRARISRTNLDRAIKAGTGPALTCIGGRRLVRTDKLVEWLDHCTQGGPQAAPAPALIPAPQQAA